MEKQINGKNLDRFAYVNDKIVTKPIRGIVVEFYGLGCLDMHWEETETGRYYAERGILFFMPYTNPWSWMNRQTVAFVDEIVDVLCAKFDLPETVPVISTGGSMGGLAALVYTKEAKRPPVGCIANCPVCDLPFHYTERPDLPRTLYSAFYEADGSLEEALATASPLHLAEKMPAVTYRIYCCEEDKSVDPTAHSKRFAAEMEKYGKHVTLCSVPQRGHCDLPGTVWNEFLGTAVRMIEENAR